MHVQRQAMAIIETQLNALEDSMFAENVMGT